MVVVGGGGLKQEKKTMVAVVESPVVAAVLLLFLFCKDISWKLDGSCCAAPPSLQRYQPLSFLFFFFCSSCFPSLFGFVSSFYVTTLLLSSSPFLFLFFLFFDRASLISFDV